jgi:hypothetical protein
MSRVPGRCQCSVKETVTNTLWSLSKPTPQAARKAARMKAFTNRAQRSGNAPEGPIQLCRLGGREYRAYRAGRPRLVDRAPSIGSMSFASSDPTSCPSSYATRFNSSDVVRFTQEAGEPFHQPVLFRDLECLWVHLRVIATHIFPTSRNPATPSASGLEDPQRCCYGQGHNVENRAGD